jgi:hypothetical protein
MSLPALRVIEYSPSASGVGVPAVHPRLLKCQPLTGAVCPKV